MISLWILWKIVWIIFIVANLYFAQKSVPGSRIRYMYFAAAVISAMHLFFCETA